MTSANLLKLALKDYANLDNYQIVYNKYGKPYLKNNAYYFSISNTCDITVCVISDKLIGVDIEHLRYNEKVIDKVCTNKEKDYINKSLNKNFSFTSIWTLKEAYVKMLGYGLSYGLKNVDTLNIKNKIQIIRAGDYIISILEEQKI